MPIELDNESHTNVFIRLNELWITETFALEEADRQLASDPYQIVREGGHILSLVEDGEVVGVCALLRESLTCFQLARMAVEPSQRGKGYGDILIQAAIAQARQRGAESIYLLSNTVLQAAISLYRKHGFETVREGRHPIYARCNIVMELGL